MEGNFKWKDGRKNGPVIFEEAGDFKGAFKIYDQKLLDELTNFHHKREMDLIFGTAGAAPANGDVPLELPIYTMPECPYDMTEEDFRQQQVERALDLFRNTGIMPVYPAADPVYRRVDPQPFIAGLDPFDRDFDAADVHMFSTAGVQVRNPYTHIIAATDQT